MLEVKIRGKQSKENSNHLPYDCVVYACGWRGTWDYKLPVDVIMCVSLAVSYVRVNLPEFPRFFIA